MDDIRLNMSLIMDSWRQTQSWCFSDKVLSEDVIAMLCAGYYDFLDMMLSDRPVFVSLSDSVRGDGRITDRTAFIKPHDLLLPVDSFLVNTPFIRMLEGEDFLEQMTTLYPLLDPDMGQLVHSMFSDWAIEHGLHCLSVKGVSDARGS